MSLLARKGHRPPAVSAGGDVTGGSLPTTDPAGYTRLYENDFNYTYPVGVIQPNGQATAAELNAVLTFYPDGWNTTHGGKVYPVLSTEPGYIQPGQPGYPAMWPAVQSKYMPSRTVMFRDSKAIMKLNSGLYGGVMTALCAAMKPKLPAWYRGGSYKYGPYGRYLYRMRATNVIVDGVDVSTAGNFTTGRNNAWHWVPLSIDSNNFPEGGEYDWLEGSTNRRVAGFYHPAATTNESWPITTPSPMSPYEWRDVEVIWEPGRLRFIVDGIVCKDTTDRVPATDLAFLFQFESDWRQAIGSCDIEIAFVVMWVRTADLP